MVAATSRAVTLLGVRATRVYLGGSEGAAKADVPHHHEPPRADRSPSPCRHELPRPAAARALDAAFGAIEEALRQGEAVRVTGFGTFRVAQHTGRAGVNPRTGERIEVATTTVPRFTPGARLKRAVR